MDAASIEKIKINLLLRKRELIKWVYHLEHDLQMPKDQPIERVEKVRFESSTLLNLKMDERYAREMEAIPGARKNRRRNIRGLRCLREADFVTAPGDHT